MESLKFPKKHHWSIVLGAVYFVMATTLCVFSYVTYAWFTSNRSVEVNFANLSADKDISFRLKYFDQNGQLGYQRSLASTYTSAAGFSYVFGTSNTGSFLDATLESDTAASYAPGYATSYAIEVTNEGTGTKKVGLFLNRFSSVASTVYYSDSTCTTGIALSEAMRVYTSYVSASDDGALTTAASTFLTATSPTNYFSHTEGTTSGGTTLATPELWGPTSGITLTGGARAVIFVSFYFTNESSTFYSYSATDGADATKMYYIHNTEGDSNVYKALKIAFSSLSLVLL
jgi:hypothetical protein